ncbi:MAG TPA: carotenoid 1,2-hydratase [Candidatus Limnocylindrales bacterium]|nr:carotenoid 1,2-hydratase [Candidatus Limnocylindrales bacterium]
MRRLLALVAIAALASGCGGEPILANEPLTFPTPPVPTEAPSRPPDPIPVELPRDDGPHDRLTEWWYYTGHLSTHGQGARQTFGFEAVIFRAERGGVPVAWASHLALTDENGQRFTYAQRTGIGPQVDRSPRGPDGQPTGFDLNIAGLNPDLVAAGAAPVATNPWRLAGSDGTDHIEAALSPEEAEASGRTFGLSLDLKSTKPPALHDHDGFVDFSDAGSSYYYSRTRLAATGTLTVDGHEMAVDGIAWFDHQWGDFVSVGSGGWNWFAINLDDGTDITISQIVDSYASVIHAYGTRVAPDGTVTYIGEEQLVSVTSLGGGFYQWTSPRTARTWATDWIVPIQHDSPEFIQDILEVKATLPSQELDTRATTGVVYWEGSATVAGAFDVGIDQLTGLPTDGTRVTGDAYVEMTRYDAVSN